MERKYHKDMCACGMSGGYEGRVNEAYHNKDCPLLGVPKSQIEGLGKECDHVFGKIAVGFEDEIHIYNMRISNEQYRKMAKDPYFESVISLLAYFCDCGEKNNLETL